MIALLLVRHLFRLHRDDQLWQKYIGTSATPTPYNNKQYISTPGDIYVSNVLFEDSKPSGAIRVQNSDRYNVLTSDSVFSNSYSSQSGGSIYVSSGSCV